MQQHEQSTVDEQDVARFSKLSSSWWDEQGEMKVLHALNQLR
jgi:2-polyprenyl-6-hydroxyphenyl methylase/3-demethylubiquinone-9 3-methyltransferase